MNPEIFVKELRRNGIDFFTGVPDSFLNGFCTYIQMNIDARHHVIAANEGNAIAMAAGHQIATGGLPLIYMQNSGMGNALNPLISLADKNVYSIPMILLIGWRGEPGIGDHDQHTAQGEITTKLLEDMNILYRILGTEDVEADIAEWAMKKALQNKQPIALVVRKGVLSGDKRKPVDDSYPLRRENAIEILLDKLPTDTIYVATTGRATRELYILRVERGESHRCDFLNVGSMGHASSVAIGIALARPERQVVCLDGDAAALMHMGVMAATDKREIPNFLHIVLNNGCHESVGGQPSAGQKIDLTEVAEACGYQTVGSPAIDRDSLLNALEQLEVRNKAGFLDMRIRAGLRDDLGPLHVSLKEDLEELRKELSKD